MGIKKEHQPPLFCLVSSVEVLGKQRRQFIEQLRLGIQPLDGLQVVFCQFAFLAIQGEFFLPVFGKVFVKKLYRRVGQGPPGTARDQIDQFGNEITFPGGEQTALPLRGQLVCLMQIPQASKIERREGIVETF